MRRGPDPERPIEAVQNAAVEHAVTVGESRDALALVGALDPLREGPAPTGTDPRTHADELADGHDRETVLDPQSRESVAVPSMTTAAVLAAWSGLRLRSDRDRPATGPATGTQEPPGPGDGIGDGDVAPSPAVVGAAVACERFDLSPASAASLADCGISVVRQVLAERDAADASSNDPRRDR
ncbi:hypothetical protein GRX01_12815 [Halobaculum sp. WSA2]|uniref:Uncharacterized protein n=1 Tax=Halobaculum saliterrae TaxID=2073113 RepID=A0A6B0SUG3_9EURY|nr:hypothetical protein [Halobaculum saliterrae]MXR42217.1 hypothetical protein [Halobaculum saliterrae]